MDYDKLNRAVWNRVLKRLQDLYDEGLILEQIGDILDVNKATISTWIREKKGGEKTTFRDMLRYLDKLGLTLEEALGSQAVGGKVGGGYSMRVPWLDPEAWEEDAGLVFDRPYLRTMGDPVAMRLLRVEGDAMAPTLEHGDLALVDTSQTDPRQDAIMCVLIDGESLLRRVRRLPGKLELLADNPAPRYAPLEIDPAVAGDSFAVSGRLCWVSRTVK